MADAPAVVLAPGKLVLVGEYAVLDGAPAIVLAIDRGVRCVVRPGGRTIEVHTPDGDTRFVSPALEGAAPGRYHFDAWNPVDLPSKPGFGGSAAACVAACVAAGRPASDALAIHHAVQGSGSGVDVLASIHGGMGRVENHTWQPLPPLVPVVTFAGSSARTGPRVQAYRAWADRVPFVEASRRVVDAFPAAPILAFRNAWRRLVEMSASAGIAYRTPAIDHIVSEAEALGGGAKPSGAGGGDCTVAVFPTPDTARRFEARMARAGLPSIVVHPAAGAHRVASPPAQG